MPIIETRTTLLQEKPLDQLGPPLPSQRKAWIQKTLANNRLPLVRTWEPLADAPVRVNQGRWIADCPICHGAEMVDPAWPFFVCCSCGYGCMRVAFPGNRREIENALLQRPHPAFMSWEPGMSVQELLDAGPFHFSWTAPRTYVTGEIVTASILNTDHRDNLLETAVAKAVAAGDLPYASGATALTVLPLGTKGRHVAVNDGETAPIYLPSRDILGSDLTTIDVVSTTAETDIFNQIIGAGILGATGGIDLLLSGDLLNNSTGTLTLRVKLGATTVLATAAGDLSNSSNRNHWFIRVLMLNSAAAAQKWHANFQTSVAGTGSWRMASGTLTYHMAIGDAASSVDTSVAQALKVTAQWSLSSANHSFRKEFALFERLAA